MTVLDYDGNEALFKLGQKLQKQSGPADGEGADAAPRVHPPAATVRRWRSTL